MMAVAKKPRAARKPRQKTGRASVRSTAPARKKAVKARAKRATGIEAIIAREADALAAEKAMLEARLNEIETRLSGLQIARDAFEGKGYSPPVGRGKAARISGRGRKPADKTALQSKKGTGRRGGVSQEVLQAISSGKATTRADLIKVFGYESDKPGQVSVSNALSQLKVKKLIKPGKARGEWLAA
jgi:hypothetical protein